MKRSRSILVATALVGGVAFTWSLGVAQLLLVPVQPRSEWEAYPFTIGSVAQRVREAFSSNAGSAPAFRTQQVERGDLVATVEAAGTVNAPVVVSVGSQLSGQIRELYADFNSTVREGEVIARVEPEMYEARVAQAEAERAMAETQRAVAAGQIARAKAELENAEARLDAAGAHTLRARVSRDDALREMERLRPLVGRNILPAGEWERLESGHKSSEAQLAAAEADELSQAATVRAAQAAQEIANAELANVVAQVQQKEAVLRQAEIDLERTHIRAPVSGTVIDRAVSGGQTLAASLQSPVLFTIAQDLTEMQVEASVVEADIGRFAAGQAVTFTVDAYPELTFTGTVNQIRQAPKVVQNVVTYIVVTSAENPERLLFPGMTANLEVVTAHRPHVLKVPNAALRYRPPPEAMPAMQAVAALTVPHAAADVPVGGSGQAFVLGAEGELQLVALTLGITDGQMTEVLGGNLREGQQVIVGPAARPRSDDTSFLVRFRFR
jgi:HlyD family secretion protein